MDKPADKRNWRCFFGSHQWEVFSVKDIELYQSENSKIPYGSYQRIILKCTHCGKIMKREL